MRTVPQVINDFNVEIAKSIRWLLNGENARKVDKPKWKQFAGLDWSKAVSVEQSCIEKDELHIAVLTTAKPSKTNRLKSIVTPTKKYIESLVQIIGKNVLLCAELVLKSHADKIKINPKQDITCGATFTRNSNKKIEGIKTDIYIPLST